MLNNSGNVSWKVGILGGVVLFVVLLFISSIGFNNGMIKLDEQRRNTLETTKVSYSQCLIKITETNSIAKAYNQDLVTLTKTAGESLQVFDSQLMTWFNTQLIPEVSPTLRENVQKEIRACRNEYVNRIDLELKPLYTEFNTRQRVFPNSLYNIFYGWNTQTFEMPKSEDVNTIFNSGIDSSLDLN